MPVTGIVVLVPFYLLLLIVVSRIIESGREDVYN